MNRWLLVLLFPFAIHGTEVRPWFGKDKLIEATPSYTYCFDPKVAVGSDKVSYDSHNHFTGLSVAISPAPEWSVEAEIDSFGTSNTRYSFEDYRITGRYLALNDVVADPLSVALGVTITQATSPALNDLNTFHPGEMAYELHIALGRELVCEQFWTSRYWAFFSTGIANRGSSWFKAVAGFDINHWDWASYGVNVTGLYGLGEHTIDLSKRFSGYGSIKFRAIDLNAYYQWTSCYGTWKLGYTFRPWAYNFPTLIQAVTASVTIPINL